MISPLQVVHQIQEGQAPTTWLVLRPGHLGGPIMCIVVGSLGGIVTMVFGTLLVASIVQPSLVHQEDAGPFGQLWLTIPMALLSLTISMVISISLTKYTKRKSDSALILLPEGVVSCEYFHDEGKRSCHVIEYANVQYIRQRVEVIRHYWTRVSLALQYQDGKQENWRIDGIYESPEWIAQRVIKAHLRFVIAHPGTLHER